MAEVIFKYVFEKDVQNFLRGTQSKNNPHPTTLQKSYIKQYGTVYSPERVREFLTDHHRATHFDGAESTRILSDLWRPGEHEYFRRADTLFKIIFPLPSITAYVSTNPRCTYNIASEYFFVYAQSPSPNKIVMHEIFHFYTWYALRSKLVASGITEVEYNLVKESLTELLNVEFLDLMPNAIDEGYPQHSEIRKRIREIWLRTRDISPVVEEAIRLVLSKN